MQEKDTLRILLGKLDRRDSLYSLCHMIYTVMSTATDNHVGYAERDPVRGNDSLVTFEEILRHAEHQQVNVTGGNIFSLIKVLININ